MSPTLDNAALGVSQGAKDSAAKNDILLHSIIEYFVLFRTRRKDAIESKSVLLWTCHHLRRAQVDRLQVLIESHNDIASFSQL